MVAVFRFPRSAILDELGGVVTGGVFAAQAEIAYVKSLLVAGRGEVFVW